MHAILPLAIGLVALLYASVGHAGATGYIAVMTLLGMPSAVIRPTALLLNVIVATIASVQFIRAGHFRPQLFWPLAVASVPCAFVGGTLTLPTDTFEAVLGGVLLASAARMLLDARRPAAQRPLEAQRVAVAVRTGAAVQGDARALRHGLPRPGHRQRRRVRGWSRGQTGCGRRGGSDSAAPAAAGSERRSQPEQADAACVANKAKGFHLGVSWWGAPLSAVARPT
jgi:hypothetical protein